LTHSSLSGKDLVLFLFFDCWAVRGSLAELNNVSVFFQWPSVDVQCYKAVEKKRWSDTLGKILSTPLPEVFYSVGVYRECS
jgi:hypothetical protein